MNMPMEKFIYMQLAEWFGTPCDYGMGAREATDIIDDPEWCEENCGEVDDWKCWKKLFEAAADNSHIEII